MPPKSYAKHFVPLESNPEIFTDLIHALGISESLQFEDIFSLDEPGFFPHPALALILVFPTNDADDVRRAGEGMEPDASNKAADDEVIWFKQTIHNACGLYAILHAVSNGESREFIGENGLWASLLKSCSSLTSAQQARKLEESEELAAGYKTAALQGSSEAPDDPTAEVEHHYICFVASRKDKHIYELDGDRKGPLKTDVVLEESEDMLSTRALSLVQTYIDKKADGNVGFSLMALVKG